ncbi:hypothetical protein D3C84_1263440 [compost metagenome]
MQQGLGGNAADIEAGAAIGGALLDDADLQAKLGRLDGADIAAGAGADNDEIISHEKVLPGSGYRPPLTLSMAPVT